MKLYRWHYIDFIKMKQKKKEKKLEAPATNDDGAAADGDEFH